MQEQTQAQEVAEVEADAAEVVTLPEDKLGEVGGGAMNSYMGP